ncbi:MAG: 16S rRNA (adenine(1518)-N(6)/adenine(1519)-N(6))-dimethyltransferase RsmA [Leptospirillia bacterium]
MKEDTPPHLRALKSLGQHFLVDKGIVRRIVEAAQVQPGEHVLEIGPGRGILTDSLLEAGARVTAIELDRGMHAQLTERYRDTPDLTLIHADALRFDLSELPRPFKVVANLPYQVTTPLLFHLLEATPPPECMVVMIQREVADRLLAEAGTKAYGVLTLGMAIRADVSRCFGVPPGAFRPPPKVSSSVMRIDPLATPRVASEMVPRFMQVVRAALGTRRKTLKNALGHLKLPPDQLLAGLEAAGIDPRLRGETLALTDYVRLTTALFPPRNAGER